MTNRALCIALLAVGSLAPFQALRAEEVASPAVTLPPATEPQAAVSPPPAESLKVIRRSYRGKAIVADSSSVVFSDSSEVKREGKLGFAAAGLGANLLTETSTLVGAYAFLTPDLAIGAEWLVGPKHLYHSNDEVRSFWGLTTGAHAYFGSSTYIGTGLGFLSAKAVRPHAQGEETSALIDLTIGNRWQWDSFTLGCNWLRFQYPLLHVSHKYSGSNDTERKALELDFHEELKGGPQISAFQLSLGFAF